MKPERALAVMQQRKIVDDANRQLKSTLSQKETKPPKLFEYKTPQQRYKGLQEFVLSMIKDPRPYGTPHVQGATPNLTIIVGQEGEEVPVRLRFEAGDDELESTLTAVWSGEDKSMKLPPHQETISQDLAFYSLTRQKEYSQSFNDFEWSLSVYLEAAMQLSAQQLARYKFPKEFIEKVAAARSEA